MADGSWVCAGVIGHEAWPASSAAPNFTESLRPVAWRFGTMWATIEVAGSWT